VRREEAGTRAEAEEGRHRRKRKQARGRAGAERGVHIYI